MCFALPGSYILFHSGFGLNEPSHFMYRFYRHNYPPDFFEYCELTHHRCRDGRFTSCMVEGDILYDYN